MVRKDSGNSSLSELNGLRIGIVTSTTALQNLEEAFAKFNGNFTPVEFETEDELFIAYENGEVDAVSDDATLLADRISTFDNPNNHRILNELISKEPLGLMVDENQSEWSTLVRWVSNTLIQAEELGINSGNIEQLLADNTNNLGNNNSSDEIRQFLGLDGNFGESLGISNDFAIQVIKAVGNYGEIYERHFDENLLPRDNNQLASEFGLQFASPLSLNQLTLNQPPTFDIDGDGQYLATVDGLLFYGYLNIRNLPSSQLVNNLTQQLADNLINPNSGATRTSGNAIASYLEDNLEMLDIDGDGEISAAIDGLLAYGYFNIRNLPESLRDNLTQQLADNLIPPDSDAIRTTGADIANFIEGYVV